MNPATSADEELTYHLRELRADLGLVASALEAAATASAGPDAVRAWVHAGALLHHDLDVHLPRALALLDAPMPAPASRPNGGADGDTAAGEAATHVAAALSALQDEDPPGPASLTLAAYEADAAQRIVAGAQDAAIRRAGD